LKRTNRLFLLLALVVVFLISWIIVLGAKSPDEKQAELIEQAARYMDDEIYVLAAPLLEEAVGYNASRTLEAENMLKRAYLQMINQSGVRGKYMDLLEKQMSRNDAGAEVFLEAAMYCLESSRFYEAYAILTDGIARTQNQDLIALYESTRYEYRMGYDYYDDVTLSVGSTIGVCINDLWGVASNDGRLLIPCEYDKVSTFSDGRAVVRRNGVMFAVDGNNNRLALFKESASDFGNYGNDRIPLLIDGRWYRASGEFLIGAMSFDWIGMYAGGYAAAQIDGKWGVVDISSNWLIPPEYDGVITDELGRSYARGAVFVTQGSSVLLFVNGVQVGQAYEDARPFENDGYAAVKRNGKWGFIDTSGEVMIDFRFDDALSFGGHLAAVRQGDYWGYVSLLGEVVIEPEFLLAKSFSGGSAPVLTDRGWRFITLVEYRTESGLM